MRVVIPITNPSFARLLAAHLGALYCFVMPVSANAVDAQALKRVEIPFFQQAHAHAHTGIDLLAYGSEDLLPPTITESGAKVQPTVTPPSANDNFNHNGMGHSHHHHGQNNGQSYGQGYGSGSNQSYNYGSGQTHTYGNGGSGSSGGGFSNNQSYTPGMNQNFGPSGSSSAYGQPQWGGSGWRNQGGNHRHRHQHNGQFGQNNQYSSQSANSNSGIQNWNTKAQVNQSHPTGGNYNSASQSASSQFQTSELERTYTQEAQAKINRIHEQTAATRSAIQAQVALNNQQVSYRRGRHGSGLRGSGNQNSSQPTAEQQRQLTEAASFEKKSIESIQQALREKQRAIASAGTSSQGQLGAMKNDLHVHNYEITDTPSGAEIPLIATPKSLKQVH